MVCGHGTQNGVAPTTATFPSTSTAAATPSHAQQAQQQMIPGPSLVGNNQLQMQGDPQLMQGDPFPLYTHADSQPSWLVANNNLPQIQGQPLLPFAFPDSQPWLGSNQQMQGLLFPPYPTPDTQFATLPWDQVPFAQAQQAYPGPSAHMSHPTDLSGQPPAPPAESAVKHGKRKATEAELEEPAAKRPITFQPWHANLEPMGMQPHQNPASSSNPLPAQSLLDALAPEPPAETVLAVQKLLDALAAQAPADAPHAEESTLVTASHPAQDAPDADLSRLSNPEAFDVSSGTWNTEEGAPAVHADEFAQFLEGLPLEGYLNAGEAEQAVPDAVGLIEVGDGDAVALHDAAGGAPADAPVEFSVLDLDSLLEEPVEEETQVASADDDARTFDILKDPFADDVMGNAEFEETMANWL
jgi:hypothetical protein